MELIARVYKINKGKYSQGAYFATVKKEELKRLKLSRDNAILLRLGCKIFPTVIRKLNSGYNSFMLGFTIPFQLAHNVISNVDNKFEFIGKSLSCEVVYSDNWINLSNLLPERSIYGLPIFLFEYQESILVWIYSKGNKYILLPKKISFSSVGYDLLELAGAFFCEGFKYRKEGRHRDRFSFSNVDLLQIKWFVEACELLLGINRKEWNVQILYPNNDVNSVEKLKNYWSSFGLLVDKIRVVKNTKTNDCCGVCILNIYNSSFAESFYYISNECNRLALLSKENAVKFFRGISRGDLGIGKTNSKIISFTTDLEENAIFFKQLCQLIGISTSNSLYDPRGKKGCWNVYIYKYENFEKLIRYDCVVHETRRQNLSRKFFTSKGSRYFDYLNAIKKGYNTAKKLRTCLNIAESTSIFYLSKFYQQGLLIRRKEKNSYVYETSEEGDRAVEFWTKKSLM